MNPNGGGYVAPGTSAGLATPTNAASTSINPLPGWPTGSTGANEGKSNGTTVHHPFGMWFANDTTLYVGDEGLASSSGSNAATGGLEKWIYNTGAGIWQYQYTVPASTIPSYSVSTIGPLQAEGLRNIAGVNNGDGTATIYGITSTTGATLNDEGADPNQLVSVADTLAATSMSAEFFAVLETAVYGDALRGVALLPKIAPTVSFTGAPATAAYGSMFTVSATTNASTTATITATGSCTVSGNAVTMTSGTGTCNLTAAWAGDSTYLPATATQSTAATLAVLTVTANSFSRPYGTANPTLTATITGFVNGETSSVVTGSPVLATTATVSSLPGNYPITVGQGTLSAVGRPLRRAYAHNSGSHKASARTKAGLEPVGDCEDFVATLSGKSTAGRALPCRPIKTQTQRCWRVSGMQVRFAGILIGEAASLTHLHRFKACAFASGKNSVGILHIGFWNSFGPLSELVSVCGRHVSDRLLSSVDINLQWMSLRSA